MDDPAQTEKRDATSSASWSLQLPNGMGVGHPQQMRADPLSPNYLLNANFFHEFLHRHSQK